MTRLTAVVLAGGLSKRFGANKLLWKVCGEHMVARVYRTLSAVAEDVYLSVRKPNQGLMLAKAAGVDPSRLVVDQASLGCSGPMAGIVTAALKTDADLLLVAPGDMPFLTPRALERFIRLFISSAADSGSVLYASGDVEALLQIHRVSWIRESGVDLSRMRGKLARASDLLRFSPRLALVGAGCLTRDAMLFTNVNTSNDLGSGRPVSDLALTAVQLMGFGPKASHAVKLFHRGRFRSSAGIFNSEGDYYVSRNVKLLAAHAYADAWFSWMASARD